MNRWNRPTTIKALGLLLIALAAEPLASAQQTPSTTPPITNTMPTPDFGFNLPSHLGTFSYSLTASEMAQIGYYGNGSVAESTVGSANLAYLSKSENDPFSLVYSGGFIHTTESGEGQNETFQDLSVSQVLRTRAWVFVISDALNYLPQSPTIGLSGIAGVGDIGTAPVQVGIGPNQSILTNYGRQVGNGLQGSATYQITGSTSLVGSASWQLLRYLGSSSPGLDTDSYTGTAGLNHRIDALNSVGVDAVYSRQMYPGYQNGVIESKGINLSYNRIWSRKLTTSISAGPEITHGEGFGSFKGQTSLSAVASLTYAGRTTGYYASYTRGVNGGSGVVPGALTDTANLGLNRPFGRSWSLGISGGYSRNVSLFDFSGLSVKLQDVVGSVQVSRRLTESLSCYGSYTALDQFGSNFEGAANAFNGLNHTLAVGITFSPAPFHRAQ